MELVALPALTSSASPDPQDLVIAVRADLRGRATPEQIALVSSNPEACLGVLRTLEQEVKDELDKRSQRLNDMLNRTQRPPNWNQRLQGHGKWARGATFFLKKVRSRIAALEQRSPAIAMRELLEEGRALDAGNADSVRAWQARVAERLALRNEV